uniref:Uncharacterized protein n=1 Tax=Arundo donax TaxID=35708 RepID=A0A0A8ZVR3_ARUDO
MEILLKLVNLLEIVGYFGTLCLSKVTCFPSVLNGMHFHILFKVRSV